MMTWVFYDFWHIGTPYYYSSTIILWEDLRRIYVPILAKTLHSAFSSRNGLTTPIPFRKWKSIEYYD